jgi:nickel-dependent lactate racemase
VNFGEVIASHLATVQFVSETIRVRVGRKFKTILTSAAGHPLDKTYYQTVKAMVTPLDILEPGGTLIVASACSEGFGSLEFRDAQKRLCALGNEAFLASIMPKPFADIDEWQTQMQLKPMRVGCVKLYTTGLGDDERAMTGVGAVASLEAALEEALCEAGDGSLAVIPEGPYVVPVVA